MVSEVWVNLMKLLQSHIPGFVLAVLIPVLFLLFMIKDENARRVLGYFSWGVFSVFFAFMINSYFQDSVIQASRLSQDIAPIVEETLKALPLLLFLIRPPGCRSLILYCAMASGIGFSIQETLYYFVSQASNRPDWLSWLPVLVRTMTTCLMHGMNTAVIGFGLMITLEHKQLRIPMLSGLLALAAVIHSLYNVLINTRLAIFALLMPAILYFLGLFLTAVPEPASQLITESPPANPSPGQSSSSS